MNRRVQQRWGVGGDRAEVELTVGSQSHNLFIGVVAQGSLNTTGSRGNK